MFVLQWAQWATPTCEVYFRADRTYDSSVVHKGQLLNGFEDRKFWDLKMVRASDLKAGVWSLKAFSSPRINYLRISKKPDSISSTSSSNWEIDFWVFSVLINEKALIPIRRKTIRARCQNPFFAEKSDFSIFVPFLKSFGSEEGPITIGDEFFSVVKMRAREPEVTFLLGSIQPQNPSDELSTRGQWKLSSSIEEDEEGATGWSGFFPKLALEKIKCISFIFKGQRL